MMYSNSRDDSIFLILDRFVSMVGCILFFIMMVWIFHGMVEMHVNIMNLVAYHNTSIIDIEK